MIYAIVLLTVLVFALVDLTLRIVMKRIDRARLRRERRAALDIGLRLEVSREATSLKHVEVERPKARILAVDDEPIVLDSFRKILVLDGYSVDTVESGREALGLIQQREYDFVFTDLKMPEFDGLEVTKAVKHLRPDIDVIMITGYATVESAVDAMKFGAMDYVQKPFTESELIDFVNKSLIRRQARIERLLPPKVHLITPSSPEMPSDRVFNVPAGVFVSPAHVWMRIEMTGEVRTGMDDFVRKTVGEIDSIRLPKVGQSVGAGEPLFSIRQGSRGMSFPAPVSGRVTRVNEELIDHVEGLKVNPYELGWVCRMEPENLPAELRTLRIGTDALAWYREEIDRLVEMIRKADRERGEAPDAAEAEPSTLSDESWNAFTASFLRA